MRGYLESPNAVRAGSCDKSPRPDSVTRATTSKAKSAYYALRLKQLHEKHAIEQRELELERNALEQERKAMQLKYKLLEEQLAERRRAFKSVRVIAGGERRISETDKVMPPTDAPPSKETADNNLSKNLVAQSGRQSKSVMQPARTEFPADRPPPSLHDEIQQQSYIAFLMKTPNEPNPIDDDIIDRVGYNLSPIAVFVTPPIESEIDEQQKLETCPQRADDSSKGLQAITVAVKFESILATTGLIQDDVFPLVSIFPRARGNENRLVMSTCLANRNVQSNAPPLLIVPEPPDPAPPPTQTTYIDETLDETTALNRFGNMNITTITSTRTLLSGQLNALLGITWLSSALAAGETIFEYAVDVHSLFERVQDTNKQSCLRIGCLLLVLVKKNLPYGNMEIWPITVMSRIPIRSTEFEMSDADPKLMRMSAEWSTNVFVMPREEKQEICVSENHEIHKRDFCCCSFRGNSVHCALGECDVIEPGCKQNLVVDSVCRDSLARVSEYFSNRSIVQSKTMLSCLLSMRRCHLRNYRGYGSLSERCYREGGWEMQISLRYYERDRGSQRRRRLQKRGCEQKIKTMFRPDCSVIFRLRHIAKQIQQEVLSNPSSKHRSVEAKTPKMHKLAVSVNWKLANIPRRESSWCDSEHINVSRGKPRRVTSFKNYSVITILMPQMIVTMFTKVGKMSDGGRKTRRNRAPSTSSPNAVELSIMDIFVLRLNAGGSNPWEPSTGSFWLHWNSNAILPKMLTIDRRCLSSFTKSYSLMRFGVIRLNLPSNIIV